ncbi:stage II sporulation protein M [Candidatus Contubernalis alkaliaceticus]|uniref:stage II sporulation protein M n=1 Tax=Candidatus Contubernalis alkaliaceticus TaxID=338645 RepID=UPI001F4C254E|nr:stage II sporulation protein M [Candidatus Contubernalis alkalaceticus]UNC92788.1 stage II sporulation protein M [Candidatus Contubernalis alkalaceticus]
MLNFNKFLRIIKENSSWIFLAAVIFILGTAAGFTAVGQNQSILEELTEPYFGLLEDLAEEVMKGGPLKGIFLIFSNNLIASVRIIFLGVLLGLAPLLGLIVNGGLIGILAGIFMVEQNVNPALFFIFGLLPHGILEIPAFLISAALGLKLGYHAIFPMEGMNRPQSIIYVAQEAINVIFYLTLIFLAAAIVEILVTPYLIQFMFP